MTYNPSVCQVRAYCETYTVVEDTNILLWWKTNAAQFPDLALMAKDIHAIPGTAVPSERTNSAAREMLPYTRNRLGHELIEATLVAKSYLIKKYAIYKCSNED